MDSPSLTPLIQVTRFVLTEAPSKAFVKQPSRQGRPFGISREIRGPNRRASPGTRRNFSLFRENFPVGEARGSREIPRLVALRDAAQELLMRPAHVMGHCRCILLSFGAAGLSLLLSHRSARAESESAPPPAIDAPQPTRVLTMAQALDYARAHQPAIRAALARVSERLQEAKIPSGQWLPTIAVTGQIFAMTANNTTGTYQQPAFMDLPRIGGTPAQATGSFSPYPSTLVGAGLLQEVFDFGRIGAQRAAADAQTEVERHRADTDRLDIDFGVEEAYFSVLAAKAVVKASDDAYERSRVHRDLAKRGVDAGLRSPIELTRAEADLDRFDVGRVRARGGVAVAQVVLSAAIGAPDPAVDAGGEAPAAADMPALTEALQLAQQRDPRLAETLAQLKAAEESTRAVGAELRPDLSRPRRSLDAREARPPPRDRPPTATAGCPTCRTGTRGSSSPGLSSTGRSRPERRRHAPSSRCAATRST